MQRRQRTQINRKRKPKDLTIRSSKKRQKNKAHIRHEHAKKMPPQKITRTNNRVVTKQQIKRTSRSLSNPHKPFFKHIWVWIVIGPLLIGGSFLALIALKNSYEPKQTTITSANTNLLTLASHSFTTNSKGVATIKGKSTAASTIYVEAVKKTTAKKNNTFTFKYTLTGPESKTITITAKNFVGQTQSENTTIVPSREYLLALMKKESHQTSANLPASSSSASASSSSQAPVQQPRQNNTQQAAQQQAQPAAVSLNTTKNVDYQLSGTTITTLQTSVGNNNELKVILNWHNDNNQNNPTYDSLFNPASVSQGGRALNSMPNTDSNTNLLSQFQNTVGANIPITYLFQLTSATAPIIVTVSAKTGATPQNIDVP